jgi:methyltransferase-like protein
MVELHLQPDPFVLEVTERPVASRVARWQAARNDRPSSLRHQLCDLHELDRLILPLFDGTRTRDDARQVLVELVRQGRLNVARGGKSVDSPEAVDLAVRELLNNALERFAKLELLEA